jgi:amidophosphoribosyltransferase
MPATDELIAAGRTEKEVEEFIGADWLIYQALDDLVRAVHHENADIVSFDTSCFSGEYVTGDVSRAYLHELSVLRSNKAKAKRDAEARRDEMDDDTVQVATGL